MGIEDVVERLHSRAVVGKSETQLADDARRMHEDYWVSAYNLIQAAIQDRKLTGAEAAVVKVEAYAGRFGRKLSPYMVQWLSDYVPPVAAVA